MGLIIEIVLTILAWNRGWKWLALLPVGIALAIGFCMGLGIGASGGSVSDVQGIAVVFDIIAIIALIIMCVKGKKPKEEEPTKVEPVKSDDTAVVEPSNEVK